MLKLLPVSLAAVVLATAFSTTVHATEPPLRLNFGVYSSNKPSAMVRVFKPALQDLERRMAERLQRPVDIRMQIARDYERGVTDLIEGRVDFSRFGPASYLEAKRTAPDLALLAMESTNDSRVFYGIIAVASDSDIHSIEDLKGRSFAFGDEASTIGRFLSQRYLEQAGLRAGSFSRYEYLGRHDKVGTAVAAGDFDAGALNEKTFKKLVESGEPLRELVRFSNVTKPWIARSGLDDRIFEALQTALLETTDPDALAGLKIDGFLSGSDADYNDIRLAIEDNAAFFAEPEASVAPLERPDATAVAKAGTQAGTQASTQASTQADAQASTQAGTQAGAVSGTAGPAPGGSTATAQQTAQQAQAPVARPASGTRQTAAAAHSMEPATTTTSATLAPPPVLQAALPHSAVVRTGNRLVINITLPSTALSTAHQGPSELVINVAIPDEGTP